MFDPSTRILVADDMSSIRAVIISNLCDIGFYDITDVGDGVAAWELINRVTPPFDLVISDMHMPDMTGLELLMKVRGDSRFSRLPFMLLTSETDKTTVMEAIAAGVSDYCVKPFTGRLFKQKLENIQKKHAAQ